MRCWPVLLLLATCATPPAPAPPLPPPLPLGRVEAEAVALGGRIYVIGGANGGEPLARVDVLDPATNTWSRAADLRTPRSFFAAAVLGGRIYALGGATPDCERYDPARDLWEAIAPLPAARTHFAAVAWRGRIHAFGGVVGRSTFSDETWTYDPAADRWTAGPKLPGARHGHCAVALDDGVHVLGGTEDFQDFTTHWSFAGESFAPRAPLPAGGMFFAAEAARGGIVVAGGLARAAARYDPRADRWTPLPDAPRVHYHGACAATAGTVWLFGGARLEGDGPFAQATVDAFDVAAGAWRIAALAAGR